MRGEGWVRASRQAGWLAGWRVGYAYCVVGIGGEEVGRMKRMGWIGEMENEVDGWMDGWVDESVGWEEVGKEGKRRRRRCKGGIGGWVLGEARGKRGGEGGER